MRANYDPDSLKFYHLNQSGTRGVRVDQYGNRERIMVYDGIVKKLRAVLYEEQAGNFSTWTVRIRGKQVMVFPDCDVDPAYWMPYDVKYPPKDGYVGDKNQEIFGFTK